MKKVLFFAALLLTTLAVSAQKLATKDATVSFDATSSLEAIKATNNGGQVALNTQTGEVAARVLIKSFNFKKALMQEHFNENYMESTKYPNATLTGKLDNLSAIKFNQDGTYKTTIKGTLDMHGVKKSVDVPAVITVKNGVISFTANFKVLCADYNIAIPSVVADKVAKEVAISISGAFPKS